MKKRYIKYFLLICAFALSISSQSMAENFQLIENNKKGMKIHLQLKKVDVQSVTKDEYSFSRVFIPGAYPTGDVGGPELPVINRLIEIPNGVEVKASVIEGKKYNVDLTEESKSKYLFPLQMSASKAGSIDGDFAFKPSLYKNYVKTRGVSNTPKVEILGSMRGKKIALLSYSPVSYDFEKGALQQVLSADIQLEFIGEANDEVNPALYSPYFENVYGQLLNNRSINPDKFWNVPVKMLIVTVKGYESQIQELVNWKIQRGFDVELAFKEDIGATKEEIAAWIKKQYDNATPKNPAPTFLLMVGDSYDVPAFEGKYTDKATDLYYASVDGDEFPEMFYGRISVSSAEELTAVINKTIKYEKAQFTDPNYLTKAEFIAGIDEQNQWHEKVGKPAVSYITNNYYTPVNGYTDVKQYVGPYSGYDTRLEEGNGFVYYTGHGLVTEWIEPKVTVEKASALTNKGIPSFVVANCCLSGNFGEAISLSEAFLRNAEGGAVGYIGSAPTSYWFEDFYWAVGAFAMKGNNDGYIPTVAESSLGAFDALFTKDNMVGDAVRFYGNLAVTQAHTQNFPTHKSSWYYWEAYNYSGDPSVSMYNGIPKGITADCQSIVLGSDKAFISGEKGAYVAVSQNNVLLGAGLIGESGKLTLPITPVNAVGEVDFVATKSGKKPTINKVSVIEIDGPYCQVLSYKVFDVEGNEVSEINANENYDLLFEVKNYGKTKATAASFVPKVIDDNILISDLSAIQIGEIEAGDAVWAKSNLRIKVGSFVEDQTVGTFALTLKEGSETWLNTLSKKINAPKLQYTACFAKKGIPMSGQKRQFVYEVVNIGHATLKGIAKTISFTGVNATSVNQDLDFSTLAVGEKKKIRVETTFENASAYKKGSAILHLTSENLAKQDLRFFFSFNVFDDFESGDISFNDYIMSDDSKPWKVVNDDFYTGRYSLRSPEVKDNSSNSISTMVRMTGLSEIKFAFYTEIEDNNDFLRFLVDGKEYGKWSGVNVWTEVSFEVGSGLHKLTWEFAKDASGKIGADAIWIDDIFITNYELYSDKDAPELLSVKGLRGVVNEDSKVQISVQDRSEVASIKAVVKLGDKQKEYDLIKDTRLYEFNKSTWSFTLPAEASPVKGICQFVLTDNKGNISHSSVCASSFAKVKSLSDNFETKDFSKLDYTFEGDVNWTVTEVEGSYVAESGSITHNQKTSLILNEDFVIDGSVSFDFKVSCEKKYDNLQLYVDDELINTWSGVYDWRSSGDIAIAAGVHKIEWRYSKDNDNSSALDKAWVDNIVINGVDDQNQFTAIAKPKFVSEPSKSGVVGTEYDYTLKVEDPNGFLLSVSETKLPNWLTITKIDETSYRVSGIPNRAGSFILSLTASNGFTTETQEATIVITEKPVGLDETANMTIVAYPNPVIESLHFNKTYTEVAVCNIQGQRLLTAVNCNKVNLSTLEGGVYLVIVKDRAGNILRKKIIKK
ncbi:MAG: C25 family cysteine peptidase [Bacteroidales bacterium]